MIGWEMQRTESLTLAEKASETSRALGRRDVPRADARRAIDAHEGDLDAALAMLHRDLMQVEATKRTNNLPVDRCTGELRCEQIQVFQIPEAVHGSPAAQI